MDGGNKEEEGIEASWERDRTPRQTTLGGKLVDGVVSSAESVEGWVLGCAEGGQGSRKVAAVMVEMGMSGEERR